MRNLTLSPDSGYGGGKVKSKAMFPWRRSGEEDSPYPSSGKDLGEGRRVAGHTWPTHCPSVPGPLCSSCKRWQCLQASSDLAPCHPCQPVWITDWEGRYQNQGDPRGERMSSTRQWERELELWGALGPCGLSLGAWSRQKWTLFSVCRLREPRYRWQGTCSPIPQSVLSPSLGCLTPSSCVCARSVLLFWRCFPE